MVTSTNALEKVFIGLILFAVLMLGFAALAPTLINSSGEVAASGLPLASLFDTDNGIVLFAIVAAIVIGVVVGALRMMRAQK